MDDVLFPPRLVCAALDIPHGTLGSWAARGHLANFDAAFASRGKARQFTLKDALSLALLRDAGSEVPVELSGFAPDAVEHWMKYRGKVRELIIGYSEGPDSASFIRYNDDVMREPKPHWTRAWSYNLDDILGRAEQALAKALQKPRLIDMYRDLDERAPLFNTISRVRG
jgi:hypothetical protein